jgi:hypothetical protein
VTKTELSWCYDPIRFCPDMIDSDSSRSLVWFAYHSDIFCIVTETLCVQQELKVKTKLKQPAFAKLGYWNMHVNRQSIHHNCR